MVSPLRSTLNRGAIFPLLTVATAFWLGGCAATTPPPEPPDPPGLVPPAAELLTARTVSLQASPLASFRSRLESGPAYMSVERTPPAPNTTGQTTWTVRRTVGPSPEGPWTPAAEMTFVLTATGDAAIAEEVNHEENVELVFDPPLIVMPAELSAAGAPFTQETYLRIFPLGNRQQTKAKGPVHQRIVHDGGALLTINNDPRPVQKVIQTFEASLKPADVKNITRQWFIPGVGIIAEEREERTRIFGIQTRLNRESWILVNDP